MELGQAEALGVLDDHQRRVRHVDADLDHRGRRPAPASRPRSKRAIASARAAASRRPWTRSTRASGKARADPLDGLARRPQVDLLGLLDQRIHDVDLLAARDGLAQQIRDLLPLARAQQQRAHGAAARRQLVDHREVEIAVERSAPACAGSASRSSRARAAACPPPPWRRVPRAAARRSGAARRSPRGRGDGTPRPPAPARGFRPRGRSRRRRGRPAPGPPRPWEPTR